MNLQRAVKEDILLICFIFFYTYLVVVFFEEFRMLYITKTALKLQLYIQDQQAL